MAQRGEENIVSGLKESANGDHSGFMFWRGTPPTPPARQSPFELRRLARVILRFILPSNSRCSSGSKYGTSRPQQDSSALSAQHYDYRPALRAWLRLSDK
jgi:hypothetical protein